MVSIEPLGFEMPMYDITTGTGDFIANGVVSHNCFARPTHEYLDLNAGRDFEREIVVKVNVPEVLRAELARPSWKGEHVALGTNTDPYQWVEGRYKLMRGIWEAFRDFRNPCSVLTKSPLLLRDLDLMKEIAAVDGVQRLPVGPDAGREGLAGDRAAHAAPAGAAGGGRRAQPQRHPDRRADRAADARDQRRARAGRADRRGCATEAGATYIGGQTLFLRGAVREIFFDWLREHRPDLVERYERLYARGRLRSRRPSGERSRCGAERRRGAAATTRRGRVPPPRAAPGGAAAAAPADATAGAPHARPTVTARSALF